MVMVFALDCIQKVVILISMNSQNQKLLIVLNNEKNIIEIKRNQIFTSNSRNRV
jgi:hypothetical protein